MPMHSLIDIGANLTHDSFDVDRAAVLARAQHAGVTQLIVTGASSDGSEQAVALATDNPGLLFATTGVHPHHASEYNSATDELLRELATRTSVVAVGECGLDYFRDFSPREDQHSAFAAQLQIAADVGKPLFLHQRDAHDDFIKILAPRMQDISGGVAHCFTAGPAEMHAYLELGLYIGITGWICDERRSQDLREAVKSLPLDRVLVETDAPYLLPRDLPEKIAGRRNEPATLPHITRMLAEYMQTDPQELSAATYRNTIKLFDLPTNHD